jgi:uncharacterized membrane protein YjjP (DUF1212 family)
LAAAVLVAFAGAVAAFLAADFLTVPTFGTLPLATISRKPAPGRKAGTDVFFTFTASPVRGFLAVLAARARFSKTPNPVMATLSPLVTTTWISASTASSAAAACFLSPRRAASASMSSALFTMSLPIRIAWTHMSHTVGQRMPNAVRIQIHSGKETVVS